MKAGPQLRGWGLAFGVFGAGAVGLRGYGFRVWSCRAGRDRALARERRPSAAAQAQGRAGVARAAGRGAKRPGPLIE